MPSEPPGPAGNARLFDGRSARARPAAVRPGVLGLAVVTLDDADEQHWAWADVRPGPARPDGAGFGHAGDDARRLVVTDPATAATIRQRAAAAGRPARRRRLALGAGLVLAVPLLLWLALGELLPALAGPLARAVPADWQRELGRALVADYLAAHPACEGEAGLAALDRLAGRLAAAAGLGTALEVRVAKHDLANAFAAPGAQVVLLSGLIDRAETAEEVAAVLAHEIAHVARGHPLRQAVRVAGFRVVAGVLLGGSDVAGLAGEVAGVLLLQSYSRDAEREADRLALEYLAGAGIDGRPFAAMFRRRSRAGEAGSGGGWLSSHPADAERVALVEQEAQPGGRALAPDEWRALRAICG